MQIEGKIRMNDENIVIEQLEKLVTRGLPYRTLEQDRQNYLQYFLRLLSCGMKHEQVNE